MNYSNRSQRRNDRHSNSPSFNYNFKNEWITEGADDQMVEFCNKLSKYMTTGKKEEKVSSSQLRNIYGEVMRIKQEMMKIKDEQIPVDFILLKPKVAYNYGRIKNKIQKDKFKEFVKVFDQVHSLVKDKNTFDNFQKFFEAILAYHKYYGGN